MKVIAKKNRELALINAQNTQNENRAETITLVVPEEYEDYNKKIVFVTDDETVWDIITNNEYKITNAITKYDKVDFYIWLTKEVDGESIDFRTKTKTLNFYHNVDASDEITDEEIHGVNTVVNLLEEEIEKVENLNIEATKIGSTTTVTITKKDGTTESVEINDGADGQDGYTPQKGIDYFTEQDIEEIEGDILNEVYTKSETDTLLEEKADVEDIPDVSSFITKDVNNLTNYTLKTNTGSLIDLEINDTTYVVTLKLKNQDGTIISTDTIDLPLESVVVSGRYDNTTKKVILTLENGSEVDFSVADLVAGLQTEITSQNKLASDLVDDTNSGNKFVTTSEKNTWNAKYDKPSGGIPKTDLANDVQTSLGKADSAIQNSDLTDYVKNTDFAGSNKGGVIKTNSFYGTSQTGGYLCGSTRTYSQYLSGSSQVLIGKGTLENVIKAKKLKITSKNEGNNIDISIKVPLEYSQLEYIESSGTQWINPNITPGNNIGIDISYAYLTISSSINAGICGTYQGNSPRTDNLFITTSTGKTNANMFFAHRGTEINSGIPPTANTKYNVKINWLNDGTIKFNDTKLVDTGTNNIESGDIHLFGRLSAGSYSYTNARIYRCKFSDETTIIRDLLPVRRNDDNVLGLYDIINNVFYQNGGTENFIEGEEATPIISAELDELQIENERIKATLPYTTGTGETVTLDKTAEFEFIKPPLPMGNSEQESTTGKNLLDKQYFETGSIDETTGQNIANDYNGRGNNYIPVLPNTTYTLSVNTIITNLRLSEYTNDKTHIQRNVIYRNSKLTITTTANTYFLRWSLNYNNSTILTQEIINSINLQLEEGSTATDYEPYTGGQASPNPDYPQEITNVTGDVEVVVENKNWFNEEKLSQEANYNTYDTTTGLWTCPDTSSNNLYNRSILYNATGYESKRRVEFLIKVQENKRYTLSLINLQQNINWNIGAYDEHGNNIQVFESTQSFKTFTTPANCKYIDIRRESPNTSLVFSHIQLEEGTTATTYTPHKEQIFPLTLGNIELCKIGDYQDYFYKESNKWYLHKKINKIVLDGSESGWSITTRSDGTTKFFARTYVNEILTNNTSASNELSNYFTVGNPYTSIEDKIWLFKQGNNTTLRIGFKDQETITTVSEFKEWLSTHNTELYYPLATPTDTEITDTILISQLEAISKAISYEEQTNISGKSDESNPIFNVEAYQNTKLILKEMATAIVALGGV